MPAHFTASDGSHDHLFKPRCDLSQTGTFLVRAPTGPDPEHTMFGVLQCDYCGKWFAFPEQNYALALPDFREAFEAALGGPPSAERDL